MKHLGFCLSVAGALFIGTAALAQDAPDHPAQAHRAAHARPDAKALEKQHHAQDAHAKDVEQGRKDPCATLVAGKREACLKHKKPQH